MTFLATSASHIKENKLFLKNLLDSVKLLIIFPCWDLNFNAQKNPPFINTTIWRCFLYSPEVLTEKRAASLTFQFCSICLKDSITKLQIALPRFPAEVTVVFLCQLKKWYFPTWHVKIRWIFSFITELCIASFAKQKDLKFWNFWGSNMKIRDVGSKWSLHR